MSETNESLEARTRRIHECLTVEDAADEARRVAETWRDWLAAVDYVLETELL